MKASVRVSLLGAFAWALMILLPYSTSPVHAAVVVIPEISLNSSTVQVVHNTPANTDVLNMSMNVTNIGDSGTGDCNSGLNDPLESLFIVAVSRFSCATFASCIGVTCPDFLTGLIYVEHDIGSASYGTSFLPNAAGFVSSKIVALPTPPDTCGTWNINLQATGQNLSLITGNKVSLMLGDADADGGPLLSLACFDVNANVGNGIVKPHRGVHHARH